MTIYMQILTGMNCLVCLVTNSNIFFGSVHIHDTYLTSYFRDL